MDTFDYKPELDRRHGQPFDPGSHVEAPTSAPGNLMKSPFPFQQHGECGPVGQQRLPRARRLRRRPGVPDGAVVEDQRARPGQLHDEHRLPDARVSRAWGPGCRTAWARSERQPADASSCCPIPKGLPYNAKGNFTAGLSAAVAPGDDPRSRLAAADPRPVPAAVGPVHHAGQPSARAWRCWRG